MTATIAISIAAVLFAVFRVGMCWGAHRALLERLPATRSELDKAYRAQRADLRAVLPGRVQR